MPGGDGTGPVGMGQMTGRAAGYCAGYSIPGYANPNNGRGLYGRGFGGGRSFMGGRGMGRRNWRGAMNSYAPYNYPAPELTPEVEVGMLKNQAKHMQEDINEVNVRIKELEKLASQQKKS